MKLSIRALAAFVACPGVVAGLVPIAIGYGEAHAGRLQAAAILPLGVGFGLLAWCVRDFFVSGHGTLAPWDPPTRLVVVGLYRYVRNPMYIAILTIVLGWAVYFGSPWLLLYLACLAIGFHLRVILHEEPWLSRQFGADWTRYSESVRRWIPKFHAR